MDDFLVIRADLSCSPTVEDAINSLVSYKIRPASKNWNWPENGLKIIKKIIQLLQRLLQLLLQVPVSLRQEKREALPICLLDAQ